MKLLRKRVVPPIVQQALDTVDEANKATAEASEAVQKYWAARHNAKQEYAAAEVRRVQRRKR